MRRTVIWMLGCGVAALACGSEGDTAEGSAFGTGGSSAASSGGSSGSGTGGASASGGGGSSATGGSLNLTGGTAGTGGASASGGSSASGGAAGAGTGGTTATGGAAGAGGSCSIDGGQGASGGSGGSQAGQETCNDGLDQDLDGFVDEGCSCNAGDSQSCFLGDPALAGRGACVRGTQTCIQSGEFGQWGPCTGSGKPGVEVCEGAIDENCNGAVDEACGCCSGDTRACGVQIGVCTTGQQTCVAGQWGPCSVNNPGDEICNNQLDDDCDGQVDEGCVLDVTVNIDGDCVTASCPPQAPFAIGCQINFQGGDSRGCVANDGGAVVYFQEGDACGAGHLSGSLRCSSQDPSPGTPGTNLDATNCPINKSQKIYASNQSGCPDT